MLKKNSHVVPSTRVGLGFIPQNLVCITIKRATINHVLEGEISSTKDAVGKYEKKTPRTSVFKRLGKTPRVSVFKRLGRKCGGEITKVGKSNGFDKPQITQKLRSLIISRMKRYTTLTVLCGRELKVKMKTVIFTQHIKDEDDRESVASSYYAASGVQNTLPHNTLNQLQRDISCLVRMGVIKINNVAHIVWVRRRDGTMRKCIYFNSPEEMNEEIASSYHITLSEEVTVKEEHAEIAPPQFEEGVKSTINELKEINLGDENDPRPTYMSALLTADEVHSYTELLKEFKDVFAWSYKEMSGLNPKIVVHHLAVKKEIWPVKQAQRRFLPYLIPFIEAEVNKLIEVGFIREVKYPTWISNIVHVRKRNGQIQVYVDFRDLNEACLKDDFPLPIAELMIDATTGYEALSFMDGSSGYNQIRMSPEDEELTAFRTPKGIYCYTVMPFGLKNAR
ncbi:hypothetical protein C2S51_016193 [Perilla frutescens var. frutescens]|nr:hypothetical protein C2S51_016193 [Perilla frutescens var. frutescens]